MDLSKVSTEDLKAEILARKDNPELHDKVRVLVGQWANDGHDWVSKIFYSGTTDFESSILAISTDEFICLDYRRDASALGLFVSAELGLEIRAYLFDAASAMDLEKRKTKGGWTEVFSRE
jgi:hypothetical protein